MLAMLYMLALRPPRASGTTAKAYEK